MPASLPDLPTDHTGKLFGIVYITLTGVIDTIIPVASPWSWVGNSVSYLFKLAPLLWWALPAKTLAQVTPENDRPAARDWIPDMPGLTPTPLVMPACVPGLEFYHPHPLNLPPGHFRDQIPPTIKEIPTTLP
ncbi:hypothetical protein DSO57_1036807 [Entomophthora muscae]|uniref:Uncharacterized protein n=1 Tax=Entomophthora muscae TaxID=34485 RepID=A0ACC2SNL0_9FUNG|nr:hypothetical protein DSO57_1036807 [Entomophthora muscae]